MQKLSNYLKKNLLEPLPRLELEILHDNFFKPPTQQHTNDLYDLYAANDEDIVIPSNSSTIIPLGFRARIFPQCYTAFIFPRSGNAFKYRVTLTNCVGCIEPDFDEEWCVLLTNFGKDDFKVCRGDRIAQVLFLKRTDMPIFEVDSLDYNDSKRRGGFGSTGK
jgi:dUTP pyrophosphatase